jgi:hypothetical protein
MEDEVLLVWGGTNDHEAWEGAYVSRSEDEDALIVVLGPKGRRR